MCLTIDTLIHETDIYVKDKNRQTLCKPQSFIADRPLLVWKRLRYNGKTYNAPYRGTVYKMGVQYSARLGVSDTGFFVYEGLHAFVLESTANRSIKCALFRSNKICPAVIPKGASVYFGEDGDVVSTRLTVYANMQLLLRAYGVKTLAPAVARNRVNARKK